MQTSCSHVVRRAWAGRLAVTWFRPWAGQWLDHGRGTGTVTLATRAWAGVGALLPLLNTEKTDPTLLSPPTPSYSVVKCGKHIWLPGSKAASLIKLLCGLGGSYGGVM